MNLDPPADESRSASYGSPLDLIWIRKNTLCELLLFLVLQVFSVLFKSDEERTPIYHVVEETFHHLLSIFSRLVQIGNPSIEVADLIKLICKIFWSSIYLEIPNKLFDPNVFNAWMVLFLNILE
ncbi:hypothetical protein L2E82_31309 [Cichorium intybus]|uniref:Uncharacterized protein n=1 Tax=Cichorium intybus TaxID=13427 RepID=A0ACB9D2T4_CICIN|nr:hypothetical protein L2E82_31309 [Cichorium intybus]